MTSTLNKIIIFAVGAAIGSAVTWKLTKDKYEKIMVEEEQSIREYYNKKVKAYEDAANTLHDFYHEKEERRKQKENSDTKPESEDSKVLKDLKNRYYDILKDSKYTIDEPCYDGGEDRPYVIPPEEFGNADEYDIISLNYYADGVLADDWNDPIEDLEATVGKDFASHYGEYEEDCVYVRNDRLKVEYEILKNLSKFSDIIKESGDNN